MRLALTVGFRVFVCDNLAFHGDFTPVLAKHSRRFCLEDALAIGIDRMQRNFDPMRRQVANWRAQSIDDSSARVLIYRAFIEREFGAPVHLAKEVHRHYFNPVHAEFAGRTLWSLQNAFTGALKLLEPIPQFKSTASLARFFDRSALALPA